MDTKRRFPLILSSFWIKIIAFFTMACDHVGLLFEGDMPYQVNDVLRVLGRLSLPLFAFMIFEGVLHTKNFRRYALRLGIMASAISVAFMFIEYVPSINESAPYLRDQGNIFVDLLLGALAVYFLLQDKLYMKLLAILPFGISVASFIASITESCGCHGHILWFPFFMRSQYGYFVPLMCMGFYLAKVLTKYVCIHHSRITGINIENYEGTNFERLAMNILSWFALALSCVIFFIVGYILDVYAPQYLYWDNYVQLVAIFSGVFILLYSGLRGYNKKWFQYGSYLFYPLHILVIFIVYLIVYGIGG